MFRHAEYKDFLYFEISAEKQLTAASTRVQFKICFYVKAKLQKFTYKNSKNYHDGKGGRIYHQIP